MNYNPLGTEPWIVATFKNPYPATVNFDITGETTWEKLIVSNGGDDGIKFEISKINPAFTTKTVLWTHVPSDASIGVYSVPDPALYAIDLAEGEYIALALRGSRSNHREVKWHNADITISADPADFYTLSVEADPAIVDGGITPALGTNKIVKDQQITINADDFAGACPTAYTFVQWEVNGVFYSDQPQTTLVVNADMTLTAVFTASNECGDVCRPYPAGDINQDCVVDLADFAMIAGDWMDCTDPSCD